MFVPRRPIHEEPTMNGSVGEPDCRKIRRLYSSSLPSICQTLELFLDIENEAIHTFYIYRYATEEEEAKVEAGEEVCDWSH